MEISSPNFTHSSNFSYTFYWGIYGNEMTKLKTYIKWILGILGILYIFKLYQDWKNGDVDLDIDPILDKIKEGEEKLKEIDKSDPSIDEILEKWNKK